MSKFRGVKTNNAKTDAKQKIRQSALESIQGERNTLEVFCGAGEMHDLVWHQSDKYTGIDKVKFFDNRHTICGDARRAIRLVDLSEYNIFDIDAYGSPYEILADILPMVGDHERIAFVLTDGTNMDLKLGRISKGMRFFTGIDFHVAKRANVLHDEFITDVIKKTARMLSGKVENKHIAVGRTGSAMRYYTFTINRGAA